MFNSTLFFSLRDNFHTIYSVQCTMKLHNFLNFQSNANKSAIDLYRISTSGGKKMRCFDMPLVKSLVHYSVIQCVCVPFPDTH